MRGKNMSLINKVYGKIIIPASYYVKGDFRFKYFNEYKKNLGKTKKEIQAFQLTRLKKLIHHAYATVPYYRKLFDNLNLKPHDIKTLNDLKKIPVLDKKTVLSNLNKLKSSKKYKLIKIFSGGLTCNKVVIFKDIRYYQISAGVLLRDLYSLGIEPGYKSAWIWGDTNREKSFKDKVLNYLSFELNRRKMFNVFNYTDEKVIHWLKNSFNKFKPDYIYGYAGVIYDIAKCIKRNNIKIHRVRMVITTSERLERRKFIENVFKCPVYDQYGCSEVTSVAIEDRNQVMHSSDDSVIVEVTKACEVLLTPLESYGMPLIRYKPGDIGLIKKKQSERK